MNKPHRVILSLGLAMLLLGALPFPVTAQSESTPEQSDEKSKERLRQIIQMPIAIDKAIESGADTEAIQALSKEMIEADVDADSFNETMRYGPEITGKDGDVESEDGDELAEFIRTKKEEGLRGKELAGAIHAELNRRGIPAGKKTERGKRPNPADEEFVPPGQRDDKGKGKGRGGPDNAKRMDKPSGKPDQANKEAGRRGESSDNDEESEYENEDESDDEDSDEESAEKNERDNRGQGKGQSSDKSKGKGRR